MDGEYEISSGMAEYSGSLKLERQPKSHISIWDPGGAVHQLLTIDAY